MDSNIHSSGLGTEYSSLANASAEVDSLTNTQLFIARVLRSVGMNVSLYIIVLFVYPTTCGTCEPQLLSFVA